MAVIFGCGSWGDPEYVGVLYEPGVPAAGRLAAYARRFPVVEVNSTYYASPRAKATSGWVKETPPGFLFNIKLHRAFSRSVEKTARDGKLLGYLRAGVAPLVKANRLGVFLLVMSADFEPERHKLAELIPLVEALRPHLLAVELRHVAWVRGAQRERTLEFFREQKIVWVATDLPAIDGSDLMPPVDEVTHPALAYMRLHGRNPRYLEAKSAAEGHSYLYKKRELGDLLKRIERLAAGASQVHVFANNHASDFAPRTALALQEAWNQRSPDAPSPGETGVRKRAQRTSVR